MKFLLDENELAGSLILHSDFEIYMDKSSRRKQLAKGLQEQVQPLPIVSTLAKCFLQEQEHPNKFVPPNFRIHWDSSIKKELTNTPVEFKSPFDTTDMRMYDKMVRDCQQRLGISVSTSSIDMFNFAEMEHINRLKNAGHEKFKVLSPVVFEMLCLIFLASTYYNRDAVFNDGLVSMFQEILNTAQSKLKDVADIELKAENIVSDMYTSRLKEIAIKPIPLVFSNKNMDKTLPDALNTLFNMSTAFTIYDSADAHLLELAWFELHFAILHRMPIGLCQFCGSAYRLDGANARGKYAKGTCGSDECKKSLRKQRDKRNRNEDPELQREKDRIRQQRRRMKKNVLDLHEKGISIEEIAKAHKLEVSQIQI